MNEYGCDDPECSLHERRNTERFSRIPGTDISTFLGATYAGNYVVCTGGGWTVTQYLAIKLLNEIGLRGGEEAAMEAVVRMPSIQEGFSAKEMFLVEYETDVYEVGTGVLGDFDYDTEALDAAVKYTNTTYNADEARNLHRELVSMIKAGTFNGNDL